MSDHEQISLHDPALLATLRGHIRALAGGIGPRGAAGGTEERAFAYLRGALADMGVREARTLRFPAATNPVRGLWLPLAVTAALNAPGPAPEGRRGRVVWRLARAGAALVAVGAAKRVFDMLRGDRTPPLGRGQSSTLMGTIPAAGEQRSRLVLLANVDSPLVSEARRGPVPDRALGTGLLLAPLINAVAGIASAIGGPGALAGLRTGSWWGLVAATVGAHLEGRGGHTPGANDNASGVAAVLAAAAQIVARPLEHTEVWVVFAGSGETGAAGVHALLDSFGRDLTTAHFLNVTRVGSGRLFVAGRYTGRTYLTGYMASPRVLLVAEAARVAAPVLGVERGTLDDADAVATLTVRGYHGTTLTGYDPITRVPLGWHAPSDVPAAVDVDCVERAVHYIRALADEVERRARLT